MSESDLDCTNLDSPSLFSEYQFIQASSEIDKAIMDNDLMLSTSFNMHDTAGILKFSS